MGGKSEFNLFSLTWIFAIFSLLGFVMEGVWSVISFGHWDDHYSLVWGPFTIIYGFAVVGLILLYPFLGKKHFLVQFLACFVLGSVFEFMASFLQELCFKSRSWDYSHIPYNLDGRICLRMSLVWGLAGMIFLRVAATRFLKLSQIFSSKVFQTIGLGIFCFMIANFTVSILATFRYSERHFGVEATTGLDRLIDKRFPDERMRKIYYNMEFIEK